MTRRNERELMTKPTTTTTTTTMMTPFHTHRVIDYSAEAADDEDATSHVVPTLNYVDALRR